MLGREHGKKTCYFMGAFLKKRCKDNIKRIMSSANLRKDPTPIWLIQIKHYCGYSERCHAEVRDKLFGMGLSKRVEVWYQHYRGWLSERGAVYYSVCRRPLQAKKWKVKIVYELRQKGWEANIKSFKRLVGADYAGSLQKLAMARWKSLKGEQYLNRQAKTIAYLARKGYEMTLILESIKKIRTETPD